MILESFQKNTHVVVVVWLMFLVNLLSKFTLYSCIDLWVGCVLVFIKNSVGLSLKLCDNKEILIDGLEASLQLIIYSFHGNES